jgi:hypothetical protein
VLKNAVFHCPFCGEKPKVWEDVIVYARCETEGCPISTRQLDGIPLSKWNRRYGPNGELK